jgi:hypothetical protein
MVVKVSSIRVYIMVVVVVVVLVVMQANKVRMVRVVVDREESTTSQQMEQTVIGVCDTLVVVVVGHQIDVEVVHALFTQTILEVVVVQES